MKKTEKDTKSIFEKTNRYSDSSNTKKEEDTDYNIFRNGKVSIRNVVTEINTHSRENPIKVATDNKEIWRYNGSYWVNDGEDYVRMMAEKILGENVSEHFKREILSFIRDWDSYWIKRDEFDSNLNLISLENGVYDIDKKTLLKAKPEYYLTQQIPIDYDSDAKINRIEQFLQDVLYKQDIPIIQELTGYLLYRDYPIHKAFMFNGEGNNGKSTLINLLSRYVGEVNTANVSLQDLTYRRFRVSDLHGKLTNFFADLPDTALTQTGIFKILTGQDYLSADVKFKNPITFKNFAKLIFSTNRLPIARDDSDAFYRRWILISFPNKFEGEDCNPDILKEITTPEEMSGLFNWGMEGLHRLLENGKFSYSKSTDMIRDEYERKSSPIKAFAKDCLETDPDGAITKEDLYNTYTEYCRENGLTIKTNNIFARELKMFVPRIIEGQRRSNGKRIWRGISWM